MQNIQKAKKRLESKVGPVFMGEIRWANDFCWVDYCDKQTKQIKGHLISATGSAHSRWFVALSPEHGRKIIRKQRED